jgi:hypothetical protein
MPITNRLLLGIAAAAILAAGVAHAADDTLKPGKWEFTTDIKGPPMPAGTKAPPGVQIRPDGSMHVAQTVCVNARNPVPVGPPPVPPQKPGQPSCKLDKMDRNGGDVHWAMTCSGPQGSTHAEGEAHYRGDTMQANVQSHIAAPNQPAADVSQSVSGRYLGACTGKEQGPPRQPQAQPQGSPQGPGPGQAVPPPPR